MPKQSSVLLSIADDLKDLSHCLVVGDCLFLMDSYGVNADSIEKYSGTYAEMWSYSPEGYEGWWVLHCPAEIDQILEAA